MTLTKILRLPSVAIEDRDLLPKASGVYAVMRGDGVIYIGSSVRSLRVRWTSHHLDKHFQATDRIAWLRVKINPREVEQEWIRDLRPRLNRGIDNVNLEYIGTSVPPQVAVLLRKMAASEGRTLSAIVRRALEQSPVVRAEMRRNGRAA